jgi:hypothetical protein
VIYSYGSDDPGKLAQALNTSVRFPYGNANRFDRLRCEIMRGGSLRRPINYGCRVSRWPDMPYDALNRSAEAVGSKLVVFQFLSRLHILHPPLVDPATARAPFIGRKDGLSRSRGMRLFQPGDKPDKDYDFYVTALPYGREFRLHVVNDAVILASLKSAKRGVNTSHIQRSHDRGYKLEPVEDLDTGQEIRLNAIRIVKALGLDFGAVDVYETPDGTQYILEVNSAPGLQHKKTIEAYVRAFEYLKVVQR